jgi:hypothetical protein
MNLQFPCPACKRELSGPEAIVGSEVQCPSCRTVFVATAPRGSGTSGIAAERTPYKAMPVPDVANPFRQQTPDEDHPLQNSQRPASRGGYRVVLFALLVMTPLVIIIIASWLMLGRSVATTTSPRATTKPAITPKPPPPNKVVVPKGWKTFEIPNTTTRVLLPGTPAAEPEQKVEAALVNRYKLDDAKSGCHFEIATIRLPRTPVDDNQLTAWLRDQLITKLKLPASHLPEVGNPKAVFILPLGGLEWRLTLTKPAERGLLRAFVAHGDNSSTVIAFWITGIDVAVEEEVGAFFDSITILDEARKP